MYVPHTQRTTVMYVFFMRKSGGVLAYEHVTYAMQTFLHGSASPGRYATEAHTLLPPGGNLRNQVWPAGGRVGPPGLVSLGKGEWTPGNEGRTQQTRERQTFPSIQPEITDRRMC